jgi:tetratricopeptide (TPR) repeat protein
MKRLNTGLMLGAPAATAAAVLVAMTGGVGGTAAQSAPNSTSGATTGAKACAACCTEDAKAASAGAAHGSATVKTVAATSAATRSTQKPGVAKAAAAKAGATKPKASSSKSAQAAPKTKTAAQLRKEKLDALWKQTDAAFHDGDYPRAIALHRQIVAIDPTDVESYSNAAWLLWSTGKGTEALTHLQAGVKANPKNPEMWEAVGDHVGTFRKRPREAQLAYTRALQYSKPGANTQMLRRRLAHAAERAGDLQTSLTTWRGLVRDYPGVPVNRNNLRRVEAKIKSTERSS